MLEGKGSIYKHKKAHTMYIIIPSSVASDSEFPFKEGDKVTVQIVPSVGYESSLVVKKVTTI